MHDNSELQLKVRSLEKQCEEYKRAQVEAQNGAAMHITLPQLEELAPERFPCIHLWLAYPFYSLSWSVYNVSDQESQLWLAMQTIQLPLKECICRGVVRFCFISVGFVLICSLSLPPSIIRIPSHGGKAPRCVGKEVQLGRCYTHARSQYQRKRNLCHTHKQISRHMASPASVCYVFHC